MKKESLSVSMSGHLEVFDDSKGGIKVRDEWNAIHPQNASRLISRGLSNEGNSIIYRMAFGNGGTFIDAGNSYVFRPRNDGSNGAGWESRLYNEIYSEIVDDDDPNAGTDPGSAGPDNVRLGGGDSGADGNNSVISQEIGKRSNIVITCVLDENEPTGQESTNSPPPGTSINPQDNGEFIFDEIGLYSPGLPAVATSGYSSVAVGNKVSVDDTNLSPSTAYTVEIDVDGVIYNSTITTPSSGSGTSGAITFGDLCEGVNTGSWVTTGDIQNYATFFITDDGSGTYPSIDGRESYGYLTIESKTTGSGSYIEILDCGTSGDLFTTLVSSDCNAVNVNMTSGKDAGDKNSANPDNERERLMSHVIFKPVPKSAESIFRVVYTITVNVSSNSETVEQQL